MRLRGIRLLPMSMIVQMAAACPTAGGAGDETAGVETAGVETAGETRLRVVRGMRLRV